MLSCLLGKTMGLLDAYLYNKHTNKQANNVLSLSVFCTHHAEPIAIAAPLMSQCINGWNLLQFLDPLPNKKQTDS